MLARIDDEVPGLGPKAGGRGMSRKLLLLPSLLLSLSVGRIHGVDAEATCTAAAAATAAVVLGSELLVVVSWEDFFFLPRPKKDTIFMRWCIDGVSRKNKELDRRIREMSGRSTEAKLVVELLARPTDVTIDGVSRQLSLCCSILI